MEVKKNWRELTLIALGVLVILGHFVAVDALFGWANVVLGAGVALVGAWPLIKKK